MSGDDLDFSRRRAIAERLRTRSEFIARTVTDEFLVRHPDWIRRYGDAARIRGEEDATFHLEFLAGAILTDNEGSFEDYARWTGRMLAARGMEPRFLVENLRQVGNAAAEELERSEQSLVHRMVAAATRALDGDHAAEASEVRDGTALGRERSLYLQAIRSGQRRVALAVAMDALHEGASVPEIYREILQPAQYEIGRLWERNEITVATEHMATAITQYVVSQLYGHIEFPEETRGNAIVTGVRGELHQLGANMVSDVLEADGWNVRFLGTHVPHDGVVKAIDDHEPRLVGVSATVLSNLPAAADLVEDIRGRFGSEIFIMVGGSAFSAAPGAWREMGADGVGRDLREAVLMADGLDRGQGS